MSIALKRTLQFQIPLSVFLLQESEEEKIDAIRSNPEHDKNQRGYGAARWCVPRDKRELLI